MKKRDNLLKIVAITVLIAMALLSIFVLSGPATDAETYRHTIEAIDNKKATVMGFTATAATASTAIAAIPGDASTPIANQIMEISEYLFIVVCFLVLEKSLLTVMGYVACNILIPAGCLLLAIYVATRKQSLMTLGLKLVVFAVAIVLIIPFSVKISDMIYDANQSTIGQLSDEIAMPDTTEPADADDSTEEEASWLDKLKDMASGAMDQVETAVTNTGEEAKEILNKFIDAIALFIITYCAIPVIVVFFVIWLVKFLFSVTIPVPGMKQMQRTQGKNQKEDISEQAEV